MNLIILLTGLWILPNGQEITFKDYNGTNFTAALKVDKKVYFVFSGVREDKNGKTLLTSSSSEILFVAYGKLKDSPKEFDGKVAISYYLNKKQKAYTLKGKWKYVEE